MAESLGTAFVDLVLERKGYDRGLVSAQNAAKSSATSIENTFSSMTNVITANLYKLAGVMAAVFSVRQLINYTKEATLLASRVETLGVVMNIVGNNAGYTSQELKVFEASIKKMGITTQESRQSIINMSQSQIDLTKSAALARIAQDAAVIGNINSSEAFGRMIYGIKAGQTEVLRTIGINVNFMQSYEKMARELNKSAQSLTEVEKSQARANAVVEYGTRIQGAYEASMGTAGKQMLSMARYTEELKLKIGEIGLESLTKMVFAVVDGLKIADKTLSDSKMTSFMKELSDIASSFTTDFVNIFKEFGAVLKQIGILVYNLREEFQLLGATIKGILMAIEQLLKLVEAFLYLVNKAVDGWRLIELAIRGTINYMTGNTKAAKEYFDLMDKRSKEIYEADLKRDADRKAKAAVEGYDPKKSKYYNAVDVEQEKADAAKRTQIIQENMDREEKNRKFIEAARLNSAREIAKGIANVQISEMERVAKTTLDLAQSSAKQMGSLLSPLDISGQYSKTMSLIVAQEKEKNDKLVLENLKYKDIVKGIDHELALAKIKGGKDEYVVVEEMGAKRIAARLKHEETIKGINYQGYIDEVKTYQDLFSEAVAYGKAIEDLEKGIEESRKQIQSQRLSDLSIALDQEAALRKANGENAIAVDLSVAERRKAIIEKQMLDETAEKMATFAPQVLATVGSPEDAAKVQEAIEAAKLAIKVKYGAQFKQIDNDVAINKINLLKAEQDMALQVYSSRAGYEKQAYDLTIANMEKTIKAMESAKYSIDLINTYRKITTEKALDDEIKSRTNAARKLYDLQLSYLKDMGKQETSQYRDIAIARIKNEAAALEQEFKMAESSGAGGGLSAEQQAKVSAEQQLTIAMMTEWQARLEAYAAYLAGMGDLEGSKKAVAAAENMAKLKIALQDKVTKNAVDAQKTMFDKAAYTDKKIRDLDFARTQEQLGQVQAALGSMESMFTSISGMYAEGTSEQKRWAEAAKAMMIAQKAVAVVNAVVAVAAAAGGPWPVGFASMAAMLAAMGALLGSIGAGGIGGGIAATAPKAATSIAGSTVLGGEEGAASNSLENVMKILEDAHAEEYNELKGIRDEMEQLNRNITGLVSGLVRGYGNFSTSFKVPGGFASEEIKRIQSAADIAVGLTISRMFGDDNPLSTMIKNFKYFDPMAGIISLMPKLYEDMFGGRTSSALTAAGVSLNPASIRALIDGQVKVIGMAFGNITTTKSGGWFGKSSSSTTRVEDPLTAQVNRFFIQIYKNLGKTAIALAKIFGSDMNKALTYIFPKIDIDLLGLSPEEADKKLRAWISNTGDVMAKALFEDLIGQYQKINEGLLETAIRVATELVVVRDMMKMIGMEVKGSTAYLIAWSQAMVAASGDLETFQKNVGLFFEKFFSGAEQNAAKLDFLNKGLEEFGATLPDTRAGFRALVQSIDTTTEEGQKFFGFLMSMIGMVDSYYAYAEEIYSKHVDMQIKIMELLGEGTEALAMKRKLELAAMDESLWAIQKSIYVMEDALTALADAETQLSEAETKLKESFAAETDRLNVSLQETVSIISELEGYVSQLKSARESMKLDDYDSEKGAYKDAQADLSRILREMRGGNFEGLADIDKTLSLATQTDKKFYINSVDYKRDYWKTYNTIKEMEELTLDQLSIEELIANGIQEQINLLEQQLNGILGINNSVLTLAEAITNYQNAQAAVVAAQANVAAAGAAATAIATQPYVSPATGGGGGRTGGSGIVSDIVAPPHYASGGAYVEPSDYIVREPVGYPYSGGRRPTDLGRKSEFAAGGFHEGGWRMVGEQGPELEYTGPSSIFSSAQSQALMDMSEVVEEVRQLRLDLEKSNYQMLKNSNRVTKFIDKWDGDGLPDTRTLV